MADEATPTGGDAPDVNTDAGFLAAVAKSAGVEVSDEQLAAVQEDDRSIASGLTYPESTPQPRDDAGRFTAAPPAAEEPAAPEVAVTPEEGAAPTGDDPVTALLAQYDGDPSAALAAVLAERDNAQSLIGRQGNEVGELREQIAELRGRLEATAQAAPAPQTAPSTFVSEADIRNAIEQGENPGQTAMGVMSWVVANAPDMVETTERIWAEYDPYAALAFRQDRILYENEKQKGEQAGKPAGAPDEVTDWVNTQRVKEQVNAALDAARAGIPNDEWDKLKPLVLEDLGKAPAFIKQAINEGDVPTKAEAFKLIVQNARSRVVTEAVTTVAEQAAADALAGKAAATVITGGQQPPKEAATTEERTPETVAKLLQKALLETEDTSVASGLTYGNQVPGLSALVK